jgi:hypothetical protein
MKYLITLMLALMSVACTDAADIPVPTTTDKTTKNVTVRQVNPIAYEVVTKTSEGTKKKIVTVRQTVGNTYEIIEH